jgi:hypothetical protein
LIQSLNLPWHAPCSRGPRRSRTKVFPGKAVLLVGGWLALTAALVGSSGIAGEAASVGLLAFAAAVALAITRGPRGGK